MASNPPTAPVSTRFLMKFILLSIVAAALTVAIKAYAALITSSVSLLSDALESVVNLVAALVALWALGLSGKPADHNHDFGHGKAEYMSSLVEGALIFVAAAGIIFTSIRRFIVPQPVEDIGLGTALSILATLINLVVGMVLIRVGRKHRSITLEADGKHLMTDVMTTVGVIAGMIVLALTGWHWVDPSIAMLVALNILWTGYKLIHRSVVGLLDAALPEDEVATVRGAIEGVIGDDRVTLSELLTRESGRQRFAQATVVVPAHWTVARSHSLADAIEEAVATALPETQTVVHIEPDAASAADQAAQERSPI